MNQKHKNPITKSTQRVINELSHKFEGRENKNTLLDTNNP